MVLLITASKAQVKLAENSRAKRLAMGLTQEGLAERSGVALPTLRKFEQKGVISLESYVKLIMVLGGLQEMIQVSAHKPLEFSSIDEVLNSDRTTSRKRGRRT
jgi:transcriptional regulator with XRE-family HTH domain